MNPNQTIAARVGMGIVGFLGASTLLYLGRSIFIPLVIAILFAALLWPLAIGLHRRLRFSWSFSVFGAISGLIILNVAVFSAFGLLLPRVLQGIPRPNDDEGQVRIYDNVRDKLTTVIPDDERFQRVLPKVAGESSILAYIRQFLKGEYITSRLLDLTQNGLYWFVESLLILFLLLFLMLEGDMLARRIKEIFGPSLEIHAAVAETLKESAEAVRTYLVWRTIVNFGLGIFLGSIYTIIGLSEPWTWGLFTVVLCYVPYLGTLVAGVPPILDAFFSISPLAAVGVLLLFIMVVTFEGYIIVPVVMGRTMSLNATTVLLTCLFWDLVWGTPGLFLAMPIMAAVKAVLLHVEGYEAWGHLMGTDDAPEENNPPTLKITEKALSESPPPAENGTISKPAEAAAKA